MSAVIAGLTTGAVAALVDRLERSGYVRRLRDADDRRRVLIEPTRRSGDFWKRTRARSGRASRVRDNLPHAAYRRSVGAGA
jgi:DNA-binding MarR family transcriptional regulator